MTSSRTVLFVVVVGSLNACTGTADCQLSGTTGNSCIATDAGATGATGGGGSVATGGGSVSTGGGAATGGGSAVTGGGAGTGGGGSTGGHGTDAGANPLDAGVVVKEPAWLGGHPLNEWFEIPGTQGAGGAAVSAYSGFALRDSTSEIIIAAAGGHHDSADNRVVSLQLAADAPSWLLRKGPSTDTPINVDYYPDGLPSSRHTYHTEHVIESLGRVFLFGARFTYGDAFEFPSIDAFNLVTNQWDPAGTWGVMPKDSGYGVVKIRATEHVFSGGLFEWSPPKGTFSNSITTRTNDSIRFPIAHDSKRNQLFSLQWGDGQGYDPFVISASMVDLSGTAQVSITIKPSAALTQFLADKPVYAAMDYDPDNDRYLFYCGITADSAGRVFVITPNATTPWDMSILPLGPGSVTPAVVGVGGVNSRFRYVPALKGFVLLATQDANLYFLRTH